MTDRGQKHKAKSTGLKKDQAKDLRRLSHFPIIINLNKK